MYQTGLNSPIATKPVSNRENSDEDRGVIVSQQPVRDLDVSGYSCQFAGDSLSILTESDDVGSSIRTCLPVCFA